MEAGTGGMIRAGLGVCGPFLRTLPSRGAPCPRTERLRMGQKAADLTVEWICGWRGDHVPL